MNLGAILARNE